MYKTEQLKMYQLRVNFRRYFAEYGTHGDGIKAVLKNCTFCASKKVLI